MTASTLQVVPDLLEQARASFRRSMPVAPSTDEVLAARAGHFADGVRYAVGHPAALARLHAATCRLRPTATLDAWLSELLDGAIVLTDADFADVQVLDPVTGELRLVAHTGFSAEVVAHFGVVDDDRSACGRAVRTGRQVVVPDVDRAPWFAPHRAMAARAGVRSLQATPLLDYAGHVVGALSTHWHAPHSPTPDDLMLIHLFADHAGEQLAGHLGVHGPPIRAGEPARHEAGVLARTMLAALLDPAEPPHAVPHPRPPAPPDVVASAAADRLAAVADTIVSDLFAVGLLLDGASSVAGDGAVADRIAAASRGVEQVIGQIRDLIVAYGEPGPLR